VVRVLLVTCGIFVWHEIYSGHLVKGAVEFVLAVAIGGYLLRYAKNQSE
jgi:hypothetical protein